MSTKVSILPSMRTLTARLKQLKNLYEVLGPRPTSFSNPKYQAINFVRNEIYQQERYIKTVAKLAPPKEEASNG